MGVTKKPIYAREALLPMSFPAKSFQKNHVPFVGSTAAVSIGGYFRANARKITPFVGPKTAQVGRES
jgi:hypothetical protein